MKNVRLLVSTIFIWATAYSAAVIATTNPTLTQAVNQRLVLHDFNRTELSNNIGGGSETWTAKSDGDTSLTTLELAASEPREGGGSALKLSYSFATETTAETGFRTHFNNLDATPYDHLELWVKYHNDQGSSGSFKVSFSKSDAEAPELIKHGSFMATNIGNEWKRIRVPLNAMNGISQWSDIQSLTITFDSRQADAQQGTYYFDDIALIKTSEPDPAALDAVTPLKKEWEQSLGGRTVARQQLWKRLVGWPSTHLVDKSQLPDDDNEFLKQLARDTWQGLDALTDREHGLPLDTIRFGKDSVNPEHSRVGDYTNITNIGLYLLSVVAATDFEFITRQEALDKLDTTLNTLGKLEKFKGFYYNYYDTTTLEKTTNFISFVDSSWLTTGLMVVRMAFPELFDRCTALIEQGHYQSFYDDSRHLMSHGYYVNSQNPSQYHYGLLYTESRVGSLIAIGKGDVPEQHWYRMARTLPTEFGMQSLEPKSQKIKQVRGIEFSGGYHEWNGLKYIPSWGGSLFEALMPTLVVDEKKYAPDSLGLNNEIHATIHRRYALEELNYPVWGMSSSSMVATDDYSEYGVKILGSKGYKTGVISPHASALALNVTPKEAISNLRRLVELYDIYGEYGLYDAVEPLTGEVAPKYLALDQGMLFLSIANYLNDKSVQRYFESDPIAANALSILSEERFFD